MLWKRRKRTQEAAMVEIRAHVAALGWPVDHLTDEQIEEGARKMFAAAKAASLTAAEFGERLQRANRMLAAAIQRH